MSSLDKIAPPLANRMIAQFGKTVKIATFSDSTPPVKTEFTVKALIGSYQVETAYATLANTDTRITIAYSAWVSKSPGRLPAVNDRVSFDGDSLAFVDITPVYSGEKIAYYDIHAR